MNSANIAKLWAFIGPITFFYALNCWIATTKTTPPFSVALPDTRPVIVAYLGCFIVSLMLVCLSLLGYKYAKQARSPYWPLKVPVIFLENLNPQSSMTKAYQAIIIVALVILPMLSIAHFNNWVVSRADIHDKRIEQTFKKSAYYFPRELNFLSSELYRNEFCMGQDLKGDLPCARTSKDSFDGGITWFPLISPLLMHLLSFLAELSAIAYLYQLFRRREHESS